MSKPQTDTSFKKNFGMRLTRYMEHVGMTPSDASEILGVSPDLVYKAKRGDGLIGLDRLVLISIANKNLKRCNLHWLLTGEGAMLLDNQSGSLHPDLQHLSDDAVEAILALINSLKHPPS